MLLLFHWHLTTVSVRVTSSSLGKALRQRILSVYSKGGITTVYNNYLIIHNSTVHWKNTHLMRQTLQRLNTHQNYTGESQKSKQRWVLKADERWRFQEEYVQTFSSAKWSNVFIGVVSLLVWCFVCQKDDSSHVWIFVKFCILSAFSQQTTIEFWHFWTWCISGFLIKK